MAGANERFRFASIFVAFTMLAGCASTAPYQYGRREQYFKSTRLPALTETQIERGEERPLLDAVGWIVGIPSKIILWDSRIDNHDVSDDTELAIGEYLAANELSDVKVRLNQYAPLDEWRRLMANDAVGAPWRYTLGVLSVAEYAVFPGRLLGGDNYNPFTNSIHVYSDAPAVVLHEGGHSKDFSRRKYKGTYAAIYAFVPGAPLWHEAIASRDALAYLNENGSYAEQREGYHLLYPAYGTYVGGAVGGIPVVPSGLAYGVSVVGGHVLGRIKARQLPRDEEMGASTSLIKLSHPHAPEELPAAVPDSPPLPNRPLKYGDNEVFDERSMIETSAEPRG